MSILVLPLRNIERKGIPPSREMVKPLHILSNIRVPNALELMPEMIADTKRMLQSATLLAFRAPASHHRAALHLHSVVRVWLRLVLATACFIPARIFIRTRNILHYADNQYDRPFEELEFPGKIYNVEYTIAFQNDARVVRKLVELLDEVVVNMKAASGTWDFTFVALVQPLAFSYAARGLERGRNGLGLNKFTGTHVLGLVWLQVKGAEESSIADKLVSDWYRTVDDYANSIGKGSEFLYLNHADETQNPLDEYGHDSLDKIARAAKKYDPTRIFRLLETLKPPGTRYMVGMRA